MPMIPSQFPMLLPSSYSPQMLPLRGINPFTTTPFFDQLCPSFVAHMSSPVLPVFLDFLCTSNGLSTYLDRNVIKLPNSSLTSSCSQLASFYADFLPSSTVPICSLSPPVPVHDYSKPPCFYFSLDDFCDLLYFKCCFYTDSADLDDELGQWCLGTYKHVDCKVKPVPACYPEDARVHR